MPAPIDLNRYRCERLEACIFGPWRRRFGDATLHLQTTLAELGDWTLYRLAQPGDESSAAYYEFITAVRCSSALDDDQLRQEEIRCLEIHLGLSDQVRFELMCRLGWLEPFHARRLPLVDLVRRFDTLQPELADQILAPAPALPHQAALAELPPRERLVRLRQLIPQALLDFARRLDGSA
jgi:hypothetical protein